MLYGNGDSSCPAPDGWYRRRADHGDNLLALAKVQGRSLARTCGIVQRSLQPFLLTPLTDLPHCLSRKTEVGAHRRRGLSQVHLQQGQRTQYRTHRLQPAPQQLIQQLLAIPRRKLDLKPYASAHDSAIQVHRSHAKCLQWLPIHAVEILESSSR